MIRLRSILLILLINAALTRAGEVIPPVPTRHFTDTAFIVPLNVADQLDARLAAFERETSNQFLVVIYPTMQSDSSIEDYTVRVAQKWGVGQKDRKNGVVLFVFSSDRKMYIQVGYGLEGALPDAIAKTIIESEIKPHFRTGDYAGGLTAGINAIIAATKNEYTAPPPPENHPEVLFWIVMIVLLVIIVSSFFRRGGNIIYSGRGRRSGWGPGGGWYGGFPTGGFPSGGDGGWHGGGGSSGGGGGFSAGGGSFGGGGAGGSW